MRVLYQPTQDTPEDWRVVDSRDWSGLAPMDLHGLNVQGVVFDGADHYAVRNLPSGGVKVFVWYDDPSDWPPGRRWARVVTIPLLTPDPALGGAINTRHSQVIYAEASMFGFFANIYAGNPTIEVRFWSDFVPPQAKTFDGLWLSNPHHEAHRSSRSICGWREWTEGLAEHELDDNGLVKQQRPLGRWIPPKGTRTYYHNPAAGPDIHSAINPNSFARVPSGSTNETAACNQNGQTAFSATTPAGEPASPAWPTTGVYRYQIDCISIGADLAYGLLDQGSGLGHFGRVNAAATADSQTIAQDESAFTSSGLNIASITDPAWSAGAVDDRFEIVVSGFRTTGHGNQDMTLQVGELDDFADGPWPAHAGAPLLGAMF